MSVFRALLAFLFVIIVSYTAIVVTNHGLGLLRIYFGDMAKMEWPGQFNLDFLGFLALSALWLAWRHDFSLVGLALGVLGFFGGMPMLSAYLFFESRRADGDWATLLLGPARAERALQARRG